MKKTVSCIIAACLSFSLLSSALAAGPAFTDVPSGRWYYAQVTKAAQQGWVSGVGDGRFDPEGSVTHAQFALMLSKALYAGDINAQPAGAQWWTAACEVAAKHGLFDITDMANRDSWNAVANAPIEREQMAQMMYNALKDTGAKLPGYEEYSEVALSINDFIDVENDDAVAACYTLKLLSGNGNGYFAPHDNMTRAQAAVVLCNIYSYVTGDVNSEQPGKPETPVVTEKPAGALGGHYDTSVYTVPADVNKDGWLTEDEVAAVIAQLMKEYPEGTPWGEDKTYKGASWPWSGSGCAAFAMMASDRIFGDLPIRKQMDAYSIRIGDAIEDYTPHWSMIYDDWWYDEDPQYGVMFTVAGNVGGKIGVGQEGYGTMDAGIKGNLGTVWTRYPVE